MVTYLSAPDVTCPSSVLTEQPSLAAASAAVRKPSGGPVRSLRRRRGAVGPANTGKTRVAYVSWIALLRRMRVSGCTAPSLHHWGGHDAGSDEPAHSIRGRSLSRSGPSFFFSAFRAVRKLFSEYRQILRLELCPRSK